MGLNKKDAISYSTQKPMLIKTSTKTKRFERSFYTIL